MTTLVAGQSGIESTHTHTITIPLADITSGAMKDYTHGITGGHTHSLILTAQDFTDLMAGLTVTKSSNNESGDFTAHSHTVQLVCG